MSCIMIYSIVHLSLKLMFKFIHADYAYAHSDL